MTINKLIISGFKNFGIKLKGINSQIKKKLQMRFDVEKQYWII